MKKLTVFTALVLSLALLLSGCTPMLEALLSDGTSFDQMAYTRPDVKALEQSAQSVCAKAGEKDFPALEEELYAFFNLYQLFYTNLSLADIHYCINMTDTYWQEEYTYCMEQAATVDAAREEVLYALADSTHRLKLETDAYFGAGFFDAYQGENLYDETFLGLMDRENYLINEYYELSADSSGVEYGSEAFYANYGDRMAEVLVELVRVRQEQAAYAGYASYPEFAYDFYHGRNYTPQQVETYTTAVSEELYDLYCQLNTAYDWSVLSGSCYEADTFDYVQQTVLSMGGDLMDAFSAMEKADLYHITYGENKYNASFEVYLVGYESPFIFMNPTLSAVDQLTFAHEFGHFAADYVTWSTVAGTDIKEVHSQGLEYLSLVYGPQVEGLRQFKLADSLCTYVEQSAYALFEQQMYSLTGDELTAENIQALYEQIGCQFGFDSWAFDSRSFVTVTHFYTSPMYIISYVVSNDVALQLYRLELEKPGQGLSAYEDMLYSEETCILAFADSYGLNNPLDPAGLPAVRETLDIFTNG